MRAVKLAASSPWRRGANLIFTIAVLALAVVWAFTLRPQALGGPAGYVLVRGVSMEPGYRTGDLVIVRPQAAYAVGDIVAYRVPEGDVGAGVIVIHRIVGGSASEGFVMQGDNNASPDDWRPRPGDVVGSAWFSLPGAGALLQWLHTPLVLASMAAGIAAAVIAAPRKERAGGSGAENVHGHDEPSTQIDPGP